MSWKCLYQAKNLILTSAPGGFRSHDLLVISQITIPKSDLAVKMLEDDSALPLSYKGFNKVVSKASSELDKDWCRQ